MNKRNKILNLFRLKSSNKGMTLVEVLVGLALLMAVLIPLIITLTKFMSGTLIRDKLIAVEILKGEFSIIKQTNNLPPLDRQIHVNNKTFRIKCDTLQTDGFIKWQMTVYRDKDSLTSITGLLPGKITNDTAWAKTWFNK